MGEVMKNREEIIYEFWVEQREQRAARREQLKAQKLEREELNKPEYTIGIVNDDGQLEVVQAKPLSKYVKRLPEVLLVVILSLIVFAFLERS